MKRQVMVFVVLAMVSIGLVFSPAAYAKLDNDEIDVTVIVHCCFGHPFWEPLLNGAKEAAKMFDVNVDFQNAEGDVAKNVNLIEQAIANKQDAIIPMITDPDAMSEPLKKARAQGILVIASNVDSSRDPDVREAYVGAENVASGELIARRIVTEFNIPQGSKCLVSGGIVEMSHIAERVEGITKGLEKAGMKYEVVRTGETAEECLTITAQYLLANPDTACVIGAGAAPTQVAPQAMEEAGLDNIPNGGYDLTPKIVENIKAGLTTASVDQQPFWQGFLPVMMAAYHKRYGLAPASFNTSNALVDQAGLGKVEEYTGTYR